MNSNVARGILYVDDVWKNQGLPKLEPSKSESCNAAKFD